MVTQADCEAAARTFHRLRILPTCLTCNFFNDLTEICKLANQRPPAEVIVYGCALWTDNELPF